MCFKDPEACTGVKMTTMRLANEWLKTRPETTSNACLPDYLSRVSMDDLMLHVDLLTSHDIRQAPCLLTTGTQSRMWNYGLISTLRPSARTRALMLMVSDYHSEWSSA